mmetsp:Transcript_35276/g.91656  ORF Transcript_35276/g.91656 Transcript_35276/m.91656 type:complete len:648 (-) Transcript_35276:708-2651(-)
MRDYADADPQHVAVVVSAAPVVVGPREGGERVFVTFNSSDESERVTPAPIHRSFATQKVAPIELEDEMEPVRDNDVQGMESVARVIAVGDPSAHVAGHSHPFVNAMPFDEEVSGGTSYEDLVVPEGIEAQVVQVGFARRPPLSQGAPSEHSVTSAPRQHSTEDGESDVGYERYYHGGEGNERVHNSNERHEDETREGEERGEEGAGKEKSDGETGVGGGQTVNQGLHAVSSLSALHQPNQVLTTPAPTHRSHARIAAVMVSIVAAAVVAGALLVTFVAIPGMQDPSYREEWNATFPLTGMRLLHSGSTDDEFFVIRFDQPWSLFGNEYKSISVSANSYITFDASYRTYNPTILDPPGSKIVIAGGDNSVQRLYVRRHMDGLGVRFEGTNNYHGIVGSPNIVWEVVFLTEGGLRFYFETLPSTPTKAFLANGRGTVINLAPTASRVVSLQRTELTSNPVFVDVLETSSVFPLQNLDLQYEGDEDEKMFKVDLPFSVTAQAEGEANITSNKLFVASNSYIALAEEQPNVQCCPVTPTSAGMAKILLGGCDVSVQRLYVTRGADWVGIRFEGTGAWTGQVGEPTIVWEFVLERSGRGSVVFLSLPTLHSGCLFGVSVGDVTTTSLDDHLLKSMSFSLNSASNTSEVATRS